MPENAAAEGGFGRDAPSRPDDNDRGGAREDKESKAEKAETFDRAMDNANRPDRAPAAPSETTTISDDDDDDDNTTDKPDDNPDRTAGPPSIGAPPSSTSPADADPTETAEETDEEERGFVDSVIDTLSAPPTDAKGNPRSTSPVSDRIGNHTVNYSVDDLKSVFADDPGLTPDQSQALADGAAVMEGYALGPSIPSTADLALAGMNARVPGQPVAISPATTGLDPLAAERNRDLLGRAPSFDDASQVQVAGDFMPNIADIEHMTKFEVRGPGGSVTAASGRDQDGNLVTDGSVKIDGGPVSGTINTKGEGSIRVGAGPVSGQVKTDDSASIGASIPGYSKHVETDGTVVETYGGTAQLPGTSFTAKRTDHTSPEGEVTQTYTGGAGLGTRESGITAEISIVDRDIEAPPAQIDDAAQEPEVRERTYIDRPPDDVLNGERHEREMIELDARLENKRLEREAQRELVRELENTP